MELLDYFAGPEADEHNAVLTALQECEKDHTIQCGLGEDDNEDYRGLFSSMSESVLTVNFVEKLHELGFKVTKTK